MSKAKQKVITEENYDDHPLKHLAEAIDMAVLVYVEADEKWCSTKRKTEKRLKLSKNDPKRLDKVASALEAIPSYRHARDMTNSMHLLLELAAQELLTISPPNIQAAAEQLKAYALLEFMNYDALEQDEMLIVDNICKAAGVQSLPLYILSGGLRGHQ